MARGGSIRGAVERGRASADAVLSFDHEAGEWPWDYEARQEFALDERGLSIRLTCRNIERRADAVRAWPASLFPVRAGHPDRHRGHPRLDHRRAGASGRQGSGGRAAIDLRDRLVCGQGLDHGFGGWDGEARMSDPDWPYEVRLSSPEARFFQLYSPPEGGIFVAEPVTHANAALNAPEERMAGARHARARAGRGDAPRHAAGGHAANRRPFRLKLRNSALYSPRSPDRGPHAGDVGEWLKPAVC